MTRTELDSFVAHHGLKPADVETVLDLAGARPSPAELRHTGTRALQLAGLLSLAAGVIFFVAANWDAFAIFGRFALLEALLVACVGAALWRPPPQPIGRFALLGAFILAGALFALFGQTWQTGANVYELFLTWSLIGLPFVIAAGWSVAWAAWIFVLNVALALYCGLNPVGGLLWAMLAISSFTTAQSLALAMAVNFGLWLFVALRKLGPRWVRRLLVAFMVLYACWAGVIAIADGGSSLWALLILTVLLAVLGVHTFSRREDVFPFAGIAACIICLGTAFSMNHMELSGLSLAFVVAIWLVISSTLAGRLMMNLVRAWR